MGLLAWIIFATSGPPYSDDPFVDRDFVDVPTIVNARHGPAGSLELGAWLSSTFAPKYASHQGLLLDVAYAVSDSVSLGLSVGYLHGRARSVVTDATGIVGSQVEEFVACADDQANGGTCVPDANVTPRVPDYSQITGIVNALVLWSPIYGKFALGRWVEGAMSLYVVGGVGANGTRVVTATANANAQSAADFALANDGFGSGGFLSRAKFNATVGFGAKIWFGDVFNMRVEVRDLAFVDNTSGENALSHRWFVQTGVGFSVL